MSDAFLHGIEVVDIDDGIRPIQTARSSVIGIVGTAPAATETLFPLNTPVLIAAQRMAAGESTGQGTGERGKRGNDKVSKVLLCAVGHQKKE